MKLRNLSICFFSLFLSSLGVSAQSGVLAPMKIKAAKDMLKMTSPISVFYIKGDVVKKLRIKNVTTKKINMFPELEVFPDKDGKKHILRPPNPELLESLRKKVAVAPNEVIDLEVHLQALKLPALSGFNFYPVVEGARLDGSPQRVTNSVVIIANLTKAKDKVLFNHRYKKSKRGLVVLTSYKNIGTGIYYNFTTDHFITDLGGAKITGTGDSHDFKFLSPRKGEYEHQTLLPVNFKDGKYRHITILRNSGSGVILKDIKTIEIKNGDVKDL